jgi:hypothetical protein
MPPSRPPVPWYIRLQRLPGRVLEKLMRVGATIVSPIEWLFAQLGRAAMAVTERFEGVESLLLRIGYVLIWPLVMLWKLLTHIADVLLPGSVRNAFGAPVRWLSSLGLWMGHAAIRLAEALNLDVVILWLVRKTRWLWYPFAAIAGFFQAWLASRSYKQLLWGLPAVLIFGPVIATATWSKLWGQGSIADDYRLAVKQALEDKDIPRVQLYERKLAQLGVDSKMTDYQTAAALANDGKITEAYERMKQLAPEPTAGFAPAHYWILQQLLEDKLGLPKEENHRLMGIHLKHLQALGAKGPEVELLEGLWQARGNRFEEAADTLAPLVNRLPAAAVMRMQIDLSLGRLEEARSDARAIRGHMTDRNRRGARMSALDYRSWAIAEELVGNLDAARELVRQWLKLEPNNHEARKSLSLLCQQEFQ